MRPFRTKFSHPVLADKGSKKGSGKNRLRIFELFETKSGLEQRKPADSQRIDRLLWLRGKDLNQRPPGYEPDELPAALPRDIHLSLYRVPQPERIVKYYFLFFAGGAEAPAFFAFCALGLPFSGETVYNNKIKQKPEKPRRGGRGRFARLRNGGRLIPALRRLPAGRI